MLRRIIPIIILLTAIVASCHDDIWNKLNELESRVEKLEKLCNQLNTNINSLQTIVNAIEAREYVTGVQPLTENGETVGYTISFSSSLPVNVYNRQNPEKSYMPVIGIKQDADSVWCWTLDENWLLDDEDSHLSTDTCTPLLKIEDESWWLSIDDGETWKEVGSASGSSPAYANSMLQVSQDDNYIFIILANGETLKIEKRHQSGGITFVYV